MLEGKMKRTTMLLALFLAVSMIFAWGAFLNLLAIGDGGEPLEPPPDPPSLNHSYYDCYVDIMSDTGAVVDTKPGGESEVFVPVRMYATSNVTYDGLSIEAFKNTVYFDAEFLDFVGIEDGVWDADNITFGSGDCGHCVENLDSIKIEGENDTYTFPDEDWAIVYYLKFEVKCLEDYESVMDLDITSTHEGENWLDLELGGVEGYDEWGDEQSGPDEYEDGYVYLDQDYWAGFHIDTATVYLGGSTDITVSCDSMNYRNGWFVHYLEYESDLFGISAITRGDLTDDWMTMNAYPSGDNITVLGQVGTGTIIEGVESSASLYTMTFVPKRDVATDNTQSPVVFDSEEGQFMKPGGCGYLNEAVDYGLGDGLIEIPKYEVDVTLDFIGTGKKLGDYDTLVVYIENSFPLGLRAENPGSETGGDLKILIEHAEQLEFIDDVSTNSRLNLDIHDPNDSHVKIYLSPPSGKPGWLLPSDEPVELCRLEFLIPDDEDYPDWPPELGAEVINQWGSYVTLASDTTGIDTMDLGGHGDFTTTGDEVDVEMIAEVYAEDASGTYTADQPIKISTTEDLDSVYVRLTFSYPHLCVEDLTPAITGLEMSNSGGNVYLHGDNLQIDAGDGILLGTVTFGSRVIPSTQDENDIHSSTHVIDSEEGLHYVVRTSGTVSITTNPIHACDAINQWKAGDAILPKEFALHQNYPNPFNPSTTIKFDLPEYQWVKLDIYNVLGRHVISLIDSPMDAGSHEVIWEARSDVSSGVYFYSLQAGTYSDTKKLLLLK
jgi:hypothetical protein